MSEEQKDLAISEIAKGVKTIKFWWPVVMAMGAIIGVAITLTSTYDNKIAKKEDLKEIFAQLHQINNQVGDLSVRFKAYKTEDSIDKIKIKRKADSIGQVVKNIQQACTVISKKVAFVYEIKKHGPQNLPSVFTIK